jgi:DedD protein
MAADSKKFLWITLSLGIFVLILVAAGLLLFKPAGNPNDNVGQPGATTPKSADPQDYLVSAPPSPQDPATTSGGDSYLTFGTPMEPSSTTIQRVTEGTIPVPSPATSTTLRQPISTSTTTTLSPYSPISAAPATTTTTMMNEPISTTTVRTPAPRPVTTTRPPVRPKPTTTTTIKPLASSQANEDSITWIQVGSFPARASADKLRDAYTAAGISSVIMVNDIDGKSWYRVRVGPFAGRQQAKEWMDRVKAVPGASKNPFLASD